MWSCSRSVGELYIFASVSKYRSHVSRFHERDSTDEDPPVVPADSGVYCKQSTEDLPVSGSFQCSRAEMLYVISLVRGRRQPGPKVILISDRGLEFRQRYEGETVGQWDVPAASNKIPKKEKLHVNYWKYRAIGGELSVRNPDPKPV